MSSRDADALDALFAGQAPEGFVVEHVQPSEAEHYRSDSKARTGWSLRWSLPQRGKWGALAFMQMMTIFFVGVGLSLGDLLLRSDEFVPLYIDLMLLGLILLSLGVGAFVSLLGVAGFRNERLVEFAGDVLRVGAVPVSVPGTRLEEIPLAEIREVNLGSRRYRGTISYFGIELDLGRRGRRTLMTGSKESDLYLAMQIAEAAQVELREKPDAEVVVPEGFEWILSDRGWVPPSLRSDLPEVRVEGSEVGGGAGEDEQSAHGQSAHDEFGDAFADPRGAHDARETET